MADTVTLEQVEELVERLPLQEQLKLIAHIGERLSAVLPVVAPEIDKDELRRQREREANELLALCDAAAEMWEGEFDAVEDIRQMRAERDEQICQSKS